LDTNTINVSLKLVQSLAKGRNLCLICGNHDSYFKNTTDVNSINIFRDCRNVKIVDKTQEVLINGERTLLVPWLGDVSEYKTGEFDMLIGHFDISSKYLIQSYVEQHSAEESVSDENMAKLRADGLIKTNISDGMVGSFVELAKPGGTVYAGHIHQHREFMSRGRKFIFIGSPYQQNLGEMGYAAGYYVLDEQNRRTFIETAGVPKHIQLVMSKAKGFDFSALAGNIVQKIYDIDVDRNFDLEVSRRISASCPYEEMLPEYKVNLKNDGRTNCRTAELIRKSKLEYLKNYVDEMKDEDLDSKNLDRNKLFETLEKYYKAVAGN